eukprot:TRINITY_DN13679_c0_g2_i2.p1 TRINITY_DN13679_c0_g2~~TRINITY_DN13679_c0_g2_i2.p1  ORF type:complete len:378 (+),score=70.61 TRINITY_DN13679_c0_g2_i2:420-1553(+)
MRMWPALNALYIGISIDNGDSGMPWLAMDVSFTTIFVTEVVTKVALHGFVEQFFGVHKWSSWFDAALISFDITQYVISGLSIEVSGSVFRLTRLVRLTRMSRLLHSPAFRSLQSLMQGFFGALKTLGWAMVLFVSVVYVVSLLFRESLGRVQDEEVYDLFRSVPRSMFTTFRCSFGDCVTASGTAVFEHVDSLDNGWVYSLIYSGYMFVVTIGCFNVIGAIMVESTREACAASHAKQLQQRLEDHDLWATHMTYLLQQLLNLSGQEVEAQDLSPETIREFCDEDLDSGYLDQLIKLPAAVKALVELDIHVEDHEVLSDILDPDHGGTFTMIEFMDGLKRLRGDPKRSDIVNIDFMLRAVQRSVDDIAAKHVVGVAAT